MVYLFSSILNINRINYLSENVLCSKNNKIVTDILEKPGGKI